ncbi:CmpA/NrtA family ABC transporter substrate-binding protein [Psychrosphaera sp. 1_MG-2023]|uniref:CmpA/NrtA family ABC transporter substrate-binding protein n=1 Tax=Psychrosphaera sp. 1_MG-2023 TaxID=3062643 RepID=UPI0026E4604A|nr:CmpA/NrtA family ABC transporter substrate-binding protein [Psychrosphaera sp. 1_MG-2023]MDO6721143.1 CmpA/NrtA family ABC transporter substrate-binding protein [Psychrosphaera sp. 1_MG-2023]
MSSQTHLEQTQLDIGIVALTDCAPLVMAKHLGYFEQWGLDVSLHVQYSWATVRDRLNAGLLDAAQVLAPMPIASSLGLNGPKCEVINAFNLSMNGNGVTLSTALMDKVRELNNGITPPLPLEAKWLKRVIDQSGEVLKIASVYPYSCHFYQLRDWLISGDITPNKDVELIIIPPTSMTTALQNNDIDGFCVGTPWNAQAVRGGIGETVTTSSDIWQEAPEKVLAVTKEWQETNPNTYLALLAAVQQACEWLESVANRFETAIILQQYLDAPVDVIAPSLIGSCITAKGAPPRDIPGYNQFFRSNTNQPIVEQGMFLIEKMKGAGQLGDWTDTQLNEVVNNVYRNDLYESMLALRNS